MKCYASTYQLETSPLMTPDTSYYHDKYQSIYIVEL